MVQNFTPVTESHVPVVIPVAASDVTSPPKTPRQSFWARMRSGAAILLPGLLSFIVDPAVTYLSPLVTGQALQLPPEYRTYQPLVAVVLGGAVAWYQSERKRQKEAERLVAAQTMGLADASGRPTPVAATAARIVTQEAVAAAQEEGRAALRAGGLPGGTVNLPS